MPMDRPPTKAPPPDATAAFQDELYGDCPNGSCEPVKGAKKGNGCSNGGNGCSSGAMGKADMFKAMQMMPGVAAFAGLFKATIGSIGKLLGR